MDLKNLCFSHTTITNQKMIVALLLLILKIVFALPKLSPFLLFGNLCRSDGGLVRNSNL